MIRNLPLKKDRDKSCVKAWNYERYANASESFAPLRSFLAVVEPQHTKLERTPYDPFEIILDLAPPCPQSTMRRSPPGPAARGRLVSNAASRGCHDGRLLLELPWALVSNHAVERLEPG
jgi:hypothetical protein